MIQVPRSHLIDLLEFGCYMFCQGNRKHDNLYFVYMLFVHKDYFFRIIELLCLHAVKHEWYICTSNVVLLTEVPRTKTTVSRGVVRCNKSGNHIQFSLHNNYSYIEESTEGIHIHCNIHHTMFFVQYDVYST